MLIHTIDLGHNIYATDDPRWLKEEAKAIRIEYAVLNCFRTKSGQFETICAGYLQDQDGKLIFDQCNFGQAGQQAAKALKRYNIVTD